MTLRYMLDTDSVSYALRGVGAVAAAAELRYGAEHRHSRRLQRLIDAFLAPISVLPFDGAAAAAFGRLAAQLRRQGVPIGEFDTLIAAHALSVPATLVTNNLRHFGRVPHLRVETWA